MAILLETHGLEYSKRRDPHFSDSVSSRPCLKRRRRAVESDQQYGRRPAKSAIWRHVPCAGDFIFTLSLSLTHSLSLSVTLSLSLAKCSSSLLLLSLFDVIVVQRHSSQNLHQNAMTRERWKTAINIRLPFHLTSCHQQGRMTFFSHQHEAFLTRNQMAPTPGENVWL